VTQKDYPWKRFLDWLVKELRMSPYRKGNEGLSGLTAEEIGIMEGRCSR